MTYLRDVNAGRDYCIEIFWAHDIRAYVAHAPDLKGCAVTGPSRAEAAATLDGVIRDHLQLLRESGDPIPPPRSPVSVRRP